MKRLPVAVFALLSLTGSLLRAESVNVLIWDERQPRQAEAYDNFLGNEIARRLQASESDFAIRSVALDDPEQGLGDANLDWADVIIWWGHARHSDVKDENATRVLERVMNGDVDLIALHSAHWARPFVKAMNWRSIEDARKHLEKHSKGKKLTIETVAPPRERTVPIHGSVITPAVFGYKQNRNNYLGIIHLPYCCFPDYRPDAAPSTITVKLLDHPIVAGLSESFRVPHTEMYTAPFHVPEPDSVVFEERWQLGERFRSGMIWNIGKGKVFYFRPGHETYAVYKQPEMIKVLENACNWLGQ